MMSKAVLCELKSPIAERPSQRMMREIDKEQSLLQERIAKLSLKREQAASLQGYRQQVNSLLYEVSKAMKSCLSPAFLFAEKESWMKEMGTILELPAILIDVTGPNTANPQLLTQSQSELESAVEVEVQSEPETKPVEVEAEKVTAVVPVKVVQEPVKKAAIEPVAMTMEEEVRSPKVEPTVTAVVKPVTTAIVEPDETEEPDEEPEEKPNEDDIEAEPVELTSEEIALEKVKEILAASREALEQALDLQEKGKPNESWDEALEAVRLARKILAKEEGNSEALEIADTADELLRDLGADESEIEEEPVEEEVELEEPEPVEIPGTGEQSKSPAEKAELSVGERLKITDGLHKGKNATVITKEEVALDYGAIAPISEIQGFEKFEISANIKAPVPAVKEEPEEKAIAQDNEVEPGYYCLGQDEWGLIAIGPFSEKEEALYFTHTNELAVDETVYDENGLERLRAESLEEIKIQSPTPSETNPVVSENPVAHNPAPKKDQIRVGDRVVYENLTWSVVAIKKNGSLKLQKRHDRRNQG